MSTENEGRVAVYIDFDNIVISRYNQLYGRGAFQGDRVRDIDPTKPGLDVGLAERLSEATVDIGTVLDYASSFGQIIVSRAYADWSQPVNSGYRRQLVDRAVDLTQMFPLSATKNGADIRLAIDVVEDLFRLADVTHVVLVAGDSDYVALAQRVKRLGREIIAVGVAGATSRALPAACNDFSLYDDLPGFSSDDDDDHYDVDVVGPLAGSAPESDASSGAAPGEVPSTGSRTDRAAAGASSDASSGAAPGEVPSTGSKTAKNGRSGVSTRRGKGDAADGEAVIAERAGTAGSGEGAADAGSESKRGGASGSKASGRRGAKQPSGDGDTDGGVSNEAMDGGDGEHGGQATKMSARAATTLLRRALTLGHDKNGDDWLHTSAVKQQIKRLDPSFHEKSIGYSSFTDFVKSRSRIAELDKTSNGQRVRLRSRRGEG